MPDSFVSRLIQHIQSSNPDLWEYAVRQIEQDIAGRRTWGVVWMLVMALSVASFVYFMLRTESSRLEVDRLNGDDTFMVMIGLFTVFIVSFIAMGSAFSSASALEADVSYQALHWLLVEFK